MLQAWLNFLRQTKYLSVYPISEVFDWSWNQEEVRNWEINCFSNSDYSGDLVTRRSKRSFVLCALDVPVSWQLKAQRSMNLSSSKVEWVALSEAMKRVMFIVKLQLTMKISVKLLITITTDYVWAIFTTGNVTATSLTKHVEVVQVYEWVCGKWCSEKCLQNQLKMTSTFSSNT